jgi:hypothetical protein
MKWDEVKIILCVVGAGLLIAHGINKCSDVQIKRLETEQVVKTNKAEEGIKLKFGITKEKE